MRSSPDSPQLVSNRVKSSPTSSRGQRAPPGRAWRLLHYAREGDTVVVTAIGRLGRSVAEVRRTIADLGEH